MGKEGRAEAKEILSFAPVYKNTARYAHREVQEERPLGLLLRSGELPLPGALEEVSQIAAILPSRTYVGREASEEQFKKVAGDYPVLHLSMHALVDEQNPVYSQLLFSPGADSLEDGFLTVGEIYHLQLQAQLAVLSACNTGYGQLKTGEGVISLSRAFAYAGVPSTLMSLWKVPDDATADLIARFYQNIHQNADKATALHQSKLAFLDNTLQAAQAHPFYWSGFVLSGNSGAINLSGNAKSWLWFSVMGFLLLLGIGWYSVRPKAE